MNGNERVFPGPSISPPVAGLATLRSQRRGHGFNPVTSTSQEPLCSKGSCRCPRRPSVVPAMRPAVLLARPESRRPSPPSASVDELLNSPATSIIEVPCLRCGRPPTPLVDAPRPRSVGGDLLVISRNARGLAAIGRARRRDQSWSLSARDRDVTAAEYQRLTPAPHR